MRSSPNSSSESLNLNSFAAHPSETKNMIWQLNVSCFWVQSDKAKCSLQEGEESENWDNMMCPVPALNMLQFFASGREGHWWKQREARLAFVCVTAHFFCLNLCTSSIIKCSAITEDAVTTHCVAIQIREFRMCVNSLCMSFGNYAVVLAGILSFESDAVAVLDNSKVVLQRSISACWRWPIHSAIRS